MFSGGQKKTLVRKGLRLLRIFWNSKIIWEGFLIWVLYWRGVHRILSNNSGSAFLRIWLAAESHELFSQKRFIIDNLQVSKYASVLTDDKYSEEIDFWFVCVCVCVYVCVCVCVWRKMLWINLSFFKVFNLPILYGNKKITHTKTNLQLKAVGFV